MITPTTLEREKSLGRHNINNLETQLTTRKSSTIEDSDSIFKNVDAGYIMNILKHQAAKNNNKIEEEDLCLSL